MFRVPTSFDFDTYAIYYFMYVCSMYLFFMNYVCIFFTGPPVHSSFCSSISISFPFHKRDMGQGQPTNSFSAGHWASRLEAISIPQVPDPLAPLPFTPTLSPSCVKISFQIHVFCVSRLSRQRCSVSSFGPHSRRHFPLPSIAIR